MKKRALRKGEAKKNKGSYIQKLKEELKKVTWTSKKELVLCTKIVIGVTFVFGMMVYLADLLIKGALQLVGKLIHLILG